MREGCFARQAGKRDNSMICGVKWINWVGLFLYNSPIWIWLQYCVTTLFSGNRVKMREKKKRKKHVMQ